jgi:ABC-type multidrug transport system fused ATPase/permease subunit
MFNNLNEILEKKEKFFFIIIIGMTVIAGLLEVISLGILIPFISFLLNPDIVTTDKYVLEYAPTLSYYKHSVLLFASLCFILFIFFLKSLYMTWFFYNRNTFVYKVSDNISVKMYSHYISSPYPSGFDSNSSNLILTCVNEIQVFIECILLGGIELISEIILVIFLVALLFIINPSASFVAASVGLILFLIFQSFTKNKLKKWGTIRQFNETQMIEKVQQGYNGIKEIMIFLKEHYFIEEYSKATQNKSRVNIKIQTLSDIPKVILEFVAIIIFVILVYIILQTNSSIEYFIPILGVYVGASFKLLPALNRIIVSMQKLKRGSSTTLRIKDQLKDYENSKEIINQILVQKKVIPLNFKKNIIFNNVCFKYPKKNNFILENINLTIENGETIGITGSSGEGKSTLINILCGFIAPTSGSVLVDGEDIKNNKREWRSIIGYIPQTTYLFNDTIKNNISFYSDLDKNNEKKLNESIKLSQLMSLIDDLPQKEESMVGERGASLSGGQAQRIAMARIIYKDPKVLILDEATSSLDSENEKRILESIKLFKGKKTLIIVSHRDSTLLFCDKIYKVQNKKCSQVLSPNI